LVGFAGGAGLGVRKRKAMDAMTAIDALQRPAPLQIGINFSLDGLLGHVAHHDYGALRSHFCGSHRTFPQQR